MGNIVAAMAIMHAPQLFTRPPEEDPKQLDAEIAAMWVGWERFWMTPALMR